jgi:hypothetical protein
LRVYNSEVKLLPLRVTVAYLAVLLPALIAVTLLLDLSRAAMYWAWLSIIVASYTAASLWWAQWNERRAAPKKIWEWDEDPDVTPDLWVLRAVAAVLALGIAATMWFSHDIILGTALALIIFVPIWLRHAQLTKRQKRQPRQDEDH